MTGIELITQERREQVEKHGRTVELDVAQNTYHQLIYAAEALISKEYTGGVLVEDLLPIDWNEELFEKMYNKPYKERLIIAGALIAAELDRLSFDKNPNPLEKEY